MIIILLPAYNEEASLSILLQKIQKTLDNTQLRYRVIVGDDGSTDQTLPILKQFSESMPIEILRHKLNRGLGETSRDLFERAAEICKPDDIIVRMDCDNTHEPEAITALVAKLGEGFDVVIASRFQPGGGQLGVSFYRSVISRSANIFMKLFFPIHGVKEYTCGFRVYRASIIKEAIDVFGNNFIQLKGLGFTCTLEKLVKLNFLGARFAEVPFQLRYDQKESKSKMVASITTLGYLVMTVLYHWPWAGWRSKYGSRTKRQAGDS